MEGDESHHVRHLLKLPFIYLVKVDAFKNLTHVALISDPCPINVITQQVADNVECLQSVLLVRGCQHQFENLVEEECIDQVTAHTQAIPCLHSQVPNHETPVLFEGRVEQVVEQLLHCLVLVMLSLLDVLHVQQAFQSVEVVFKVQCLVVQDCLV